MLLQVAGNTPRRPGCYTALKKLVAPCHTSTLFLSVHTRDQASLSCRTLPAAAASLRGVGSVPSASIATAAAAEVTATA